MDQRRPRLGDVVDDYCPRERRLANHVVVAMIGDEIRQTRCTTCDAEHPFKNARVPPRRKKAESPAALVKQVAEGLQEKPRLNGDLAAPEPAPEHPPGPVVSAAPQIADTPLADADAPPGEPTTSVEEGPVHRQLIRATLPRLPGEEREPRPLPEFTMRAPRNARGFRQNGAGRQGGAKGGNRGRSRQAAANFRPGVMSSWSPSNPRPRGGQVPQGGGRSHQQPPRADGRKKSR